MERLALASHVQVGHACRLWVYDPVSNVPPGIAVEDAGDIFPRSRIFTYRHGPGKGSVAAFANLFRYKLLCRLGGWWCDTDVVCLKPLNFAGDHVFASERTPGSVQVTNCVIKAPKDSPVMRHCLATAEARDPASLNWGDTGPRLLTEAVRRFQLDDSVVAPETFCPVHFFDAGALLSRPVDLQSSPLRHAHAVHLWHEIWRRHGWDKNATYPDHCLYERLKRLLLEGGNSC